MQRATDLDEYVSPVQALYDGYGRRVKDLPELWQLWGRLMRRAVSTKVVRTRNKPTELLCIAFGGKLYMFVVLRSDST